MAACKDARVMKEDARVVKIEDLELDEDHVAALATTRTSTLRLLAAAEGRGEA